MREYYGKIMGSEIVSGSPVETLTGPTRGLGRC